MMSHKYKTVRPAQVRRAQAGEDEQRTRRRLIEIAGHLIAEQGVDRVTGKAVAARAKVNAAAINYHFGGFQGLYAAVLCEAHHGLATVESLQAAVAQAPGPQAKLQAAIRLFVTTITSPASESWMVRVLGRELAAPSPALDVLREKEILPKLGVVRPIVAQLIDLPEDHPAVARACVSIIAPCLMLLIGSRPMLKRLFPNFGFTAADTPAIIDHMVRFTLAGLSAIAAEVHSQAPKGRHF